MKRLVMITLVLLIFIASVGVVYATTEGIPNPLNNKGNVSKEAKIERLEQYVSEGKITQEKADNIIKQFESCDGTGNSGIGKANGLSFGSGQGNGKGKKLGQDSSNGRRLNNPNRINCENVQ